LEEIHLPLSVRYSYAGRGTKMGSFMDRPMQLSRNYWNKNKTQVGYHIRPNLRTYYGQGFI